MVITQLDLLNSKQSKGPFIYYVSTKGGGRGVVQMLTFSDEGGGGVQGHAHVIMSFCEKGLFQQKKFHAPLILTFRFGRKLTQMTGDNSTILNIMNLSSHRNKVNYLFIMFNVHNAYIAIATLFKDFLMDGRRSQIWGCTTGGLERVVSLHNST